MDNNNKKTPDNNKKQPPTKFVKIKNPYKKPRYNYHSSVRNPYAQARHNHAWEYATETKVSTEGKYIVFYCFCV